MINYHKKNKGFSIIELMVVLVLFTITATIVIFNQSQYRNTISLENLSQDIALNIRKAQVYALGVRGITTGGPVQFTGYGLRFSGISNSNSLQGNDKSFVFFADIPLGVIGPGNFRYENNTNLCGPMHIMLNVNECLEVITITSADKIVGFYIVDNLGTTFVSSLLDPVLDIVFTRPNPEARFYFTTNSGMWPRIISSVGIVVESIDGARKTITVWNTGQIGVQ